MFMVVLMLVNEILIIGILLFIKYFYNLVVNYDIILKYFVKKYEIFKR